MKIGIIGGTGGMGRGFALRWSAGHEILVGSRDAARAREAAAEYSKAVEERGSCGITGDGNARVARDSDILVLSIPYERIDDVCPEVLPHVRDDAIVVSPIVPMTKTDVGFEFIPMRDGTATAHESVQRHMGANSRLVSAFHIISEKKLENLQKRLDYDIFVCGDEKAATDAVCGLVEEIDGLRALYIGGSSLAYMAEMATPLLLNAMIRNRLKNPGIKLL